MFDKGGASHPVRPSCFQTHTRVTIKVATANVDDAGIISVTGSTASTSTGQAVTLTVTPTANTTTGTITWSCAGVPAKYMPATCR